MEIKLELAESAWDVKFLLNVEGLPWDRKRRGATIRENLPRTSLPAEVPLPTEQEDMECKEELVRDGCRSQRTSKSDRTVKLLWMSRVPSESHRELTISQLQ